MMTEQEQNRKRAYDFIINNVQNFKLVSHTNRDEALADHLDISVDELISLREGKIDPSPELVKAFKRCCSLGVTEERIDIYLVTPFKTETKD